MTWLKRVGRLLSWILSAVALVILVAVALIAIPVSQPPSLDSVRAGAMAIDQTGMPGTSRFQARDGTWLAYRLYPAANGQTQNIAIVIHGSGGHSTVMNEVAKRLAADDFLVAAPDVRGHGESGTRGDIAYDGQLDDDLDDLLAELRQRYQTSRFALLGFSSGGGFALRIAAGSLSSSFDRLALLSPYLGYDAPSTRSPGDSATWASPDIPRYIALSILHRLGLRCCEGLPVIAFAVGPNSEKYVTSHYSYRLLANFAAPRDLGAAFRRLSIPTTIIAGSADELMHADKYADVVRGIEPAIGVKIVPGAGHMGMLHGAAPLDAISAAFKGK